MMLLNIEKYLRAWFKDHYDGVTPINFDTLLVEEEVAISEALADLRRFDTPKERTQYWAERYSKALLEKLLTRL